MVQTGKKRIGVWVELRIGCRLDLVAKLKEVAHKDMLAIYSTIQQKHLSTKNYTKNWMALWTP